MLFDNASGANGFNFFWIVLFLSSLLLIFISVWSQIEIQKLQERVKELEDERETDPFTGLLNYRGFQSALLRTVYPDLDRACDKGRSPNAFLFFIDMDNLKALNDTLGHEAADKVILLLASLLESSLRDNDIVARRSGDEFLIVLMDMPLLQSIEILRRISRDFQERSRSILENSSNGEKLTASFSAGGVSLNDEKLSFSFSRDQRQTLRTEDMINKINTSDMLSQQAKRAGKKRLRIKNKEYEL